MCLPYLLVTSRSHCPKPFDLCPKKHCLCSGKPFIRFPSSCSFAWQGGNLGTLAGLYFHADQYTVADGWHCRAQGWEHRSRQENAVLMPLLG